MPRARRLVRGLSRLALLAVALAPLPAHAQGISIGGPFDGEAQALSGAGGTFPGPLYAKWFDAYAKLTPS